MSSPSLLSPRGLFAPERDDFRPAQSPSDYPSRKATPDLSSLPRHAFPPRPADRNLPQLTGVTRASLLEVRPAPATVPTGIAELDALTSGIPRGALTEIFGPASSGRTSVLLALLAEMTRRQEVCALIDVSDSFHPHSAAAAGVDLDHLLWIRCSTEYRVASTESEPPRRQGDMEGSLKNRHPERSEGPAFPGHPERSEGPAFARHPEHSEGPAVHKYSALSNQHSAPSSSNADLLECRPLNTDRSNWQLGTRTSVLSPCLRGEQTRNSVLGTRYSLFRALEQALKVTDLLLQSSGFGLIAVDLGDIPPQIARRVPLTSWFRFRRAVENTPTVLLVMEQEPYAKTCASLVLKMSPQSSPLSRSYAGSIELPTHAHLLRGLGITAELVRSRLERKPPCSVAAFEAETIWRKATSR